MLRFSRPCCHYSAIIIALAIIAVCHNAHADEGQLGDANNETMPLESTILHDSNSSHANVLTATDGDSEVVKWAKARLKQLELQDADDANHETMNLRSMMNSDSESLTSPEALRDLFYADAARAEVRVRGHADDDVDEGKLHRRNTMRRLTCCEAHF